MSTELEQRRSPEAGSLPSDENLDGNVNELEAASRRGAPLVNSLELERTIDVPPPPFRFLHLPPELRNMVYELVLIEESHLKASYCCRIKEYSSIHEIRAFQHKPSTERHFWGHSRLALLATCREIYVEARAIYYSGNNLRIHSVSLSSFLDAIGADNQTQCKQLSIDCRLGLYRSSQYPELHIWSQLEKLPNLEHLILALSGFDLEDDSEQLDRDVYWRGVERLKALRTITLERSPVPYVNEAMLERDCEEQRRVNDFLARRHHEQSAKREKSPGEQAIS
ncbi:MAG: hypothetical protein M1830_000457 [Pleopsidium flavum]|nr:MAG: hypothetical protein M1830_000457 [Pleopsidium flavum]